MNLHHGAHSLLFPVSSGISHCPQHYPGVQILSATLCVASLSVQNWSSEALCPAFPPSVASTPLPRRVSSRLSRIVTCSEEGLCGQNPLFFPLSLLVYNSHLRASWGRVIGPRDANLPNTG